MRASAASIGLALLLVVPALSGCATVLPSRSVHFILVEEYLWVNTTGDDLLQVDWGPHCAEVSYVPEPELQRRVILWDQDGSTPTGVLMHTGRLGENASIGPTVASATRLVLYNPDTARLTMYGFADPTIPLVAFDVQGGVVVLNGVVVPKEHVSPPVRVAYEVVQGNATFNVTEILVVKPMGRVPIDLEKREFCV